MAESAGSALGGRIRPLWCFLFTVIDPRPSTLALIAAASLCAGAATAAEPELQIADVVIEGATQVHPDKVRFVLDTRPGKTYTPSQLQQAVADDVKAIEKMGPFSQTRADLAYGDDGRSVKVIYRLSELPYVVEVRWESFERITRNQGRIEAWRGSGPWEFAPLGYFDEDKLKKLTEVRRGSWLNPILLESDRRAILAKLQDEGSRYAKVEVETPQVPGGVAVVFRVDSGQEIEVGAVIIEGLPPGITMYQFEPGLLNPCLLYTSDAADDM
jgi:outer membrane protein assembly factor BamA